MHGTDVNWCMLHRLPLYNSCVCELGGIPLKDLLVNLTSVTDNGTASQNGPLPVVIIITTRNGLSLDSDKKK